MLAHYLRLITFAFGLLIGIQVPVSSISTPSA